jgi:CheY-like chemotaxis protein
MAKTLLLVDDSVTIQRVVELSFAHEDVRIVSMSDGQRALQWLEVDQPDIVVVDVGVPEVDGYTVATRVKNAKRTRDVPVLLLAGAFEPVDDKRVRDIGCDGVIVKPFEPKQLVERVKELVDVKPISRTSRSAPAPAPVHGAPPAMSAAAAAVANPPALRAVRSMPPPTPEPEPEPVREPEPAIAAAVVAHPAPAATAASITWADPSPPESDFRVAAAPPRVEPAPTVAPTPVAASSASSATPTAVESAPVPVAISKAPQPLELPTRPMWSGGATPPVAPLGSGGVLSAPQASAKAALVNAFSALLAVDHPPAPPAPPPPAPAPTVAVLSENMVEAAVRRVLEQMTEEQVRKIVAETAERLVREEIDRITASAEETGS